MRNKIILTIALLVIQGSCFVHAQEYRTDSVMRVEFVDTCLVSAIRLAISTAPDTGFIPESYNSIHFIESTYYDDTYSVVLNVLSPQMIPKFYYYTVIDGIPFMVNTYSEHLIKHDEYSVFEFKETGKFVSVILYKEGTYAKIVYSKMY